MDPRAEAFLRLLTIMDELREQCPWDRKQTMETLRPLTIEETYELGDAILEGDLDGVKKELGDLLLHMVFYARIGSEKQAFDITDVLHGICDKLIHRHPHIYGDVQVKDEAEVKANWEKIKLAEKALENDRSVDPSGRPVKGKFPSVIEGVPRGLPSLVKAISLSGGTFTAGMLSRFRWRTSLAPYSRMRFRISLGRFSARTSSSWSSSSTIVFIGRPIRPSNPSARRRLPWLPT